MSEKKFTAVIIDDEDHCIDKIIKSLSCYPEIKIAGTAVNAAEGTQLIIRTSPDLVFTDVEMPAESGLTMIQQLEHRMSPNTHIVFHTAFNDYLLDALRSSAFDFLLKPYQDHDFNEMMQRWFRKINWKENHSGSNGNNKTLNDKRFLVSTGDGYQLCKTENFVFAEYLSTRKIWSVKLCNETQVFLKRGSTAEDILQLAGYFIQISQYCIINSNFLSSIIDDYCVMIPPFEKIKYKITRKYMKELQERFENI